MKKLSAVVLCVLAFALLAGCANAAGENGSEGGGSDSAIWYIGTWTSEIMHKENINYRYLFEIKSDQTFIWYVKDTDTGVVYNSEDASVSTTGYTEKGSWELRKNLDWSFDDGTSEIFPEYLSLKDEENGRVFESGLVLDEGKKTLSILSVTKGTEMILKK